MNNKLFKLGRVTIETMSSEEGTYSETNNDSCTGPGGHQDGTPCG